MSRILAAAGLSLAAVAAPTRATAAPALYVGRNDARLEQKASHVVLMREGRRTTLTLQNDYAGPNAPFAMVVPVPAAITKDDVHTLKKEDVDAIDRFSSPRLVEYWEQDPCGTASALRLKPPTEAADAGTPRPGPDLGAMVTGTFVAGEYDVAIVPPADVVARLRQDGYAVSADVESSLKPYVDAGDTFVIAKVDASKLKLENGRAALSPLRVSYEEPELTLPVRLGVEKEPQDLVIEILGNGTRYEPAGAPSSIIPTNLDVSEATHGSFSSFYGALFSKTLEKTPNAVVTEYAWGATTCDPCTGPVLSGWSLASFGDDVLPRDTNPEHVAVVLPRGVVKDAVARAASTALASALGTCFQPLAMKNPELHGGVDLALAYDEHGAGKTVTFVKDEIQRPELGACMKTRASAIRVPAGGTAGSTTLSFTVTSRTEPKWRNWTVTRLHARGGTFTEDLHFKEAPAIAGGREVRGEGSRIEQGTSAPKDNVNAFEARYAIRHPWTGAVTCASPRRGVWGSSPKGDAATSDAGTSSVASRLAFLDHNPPVDLAKLVFSDAPAIDLHGPPAGEPSDAGAVAPAPSASKDAPARGCGGCGIGAIGAVFFVTRRRRAS